MTEVLSIRISSSHKKLCTHLDFYSNINEKPMIFDELINDELNIIDQDDYEFKYNLINKNTDRSVKGFYVFVDTKERFNTSYKTIKACYKQKSIYISKGDFMEYLLESYSSKHLSNWKQIKRELKI
jgi:hypothetical protein